MLREKCKESYRGAGGKYLSCLLYSFGQKPMFWDWLLPGDTVRGVKEEDTW